MGLVAEISGMVRCHSRCALLHGGAEIRRQWCLGEGVLFYQHVDGFRSDDQTLVAGDAEFGGQCE